MDLAREAVYDNELVYWLLLLVSLWRCVKVDTLGAPQEDNLDQSYDPSSYFYITG